MDKGEQESFDEMRREVERRMPLVENALRVLGEHFSGVLILVHRYDSKSNITIQTSRSIGDPLAARQAAQQFLQEQSLRDQMLFARRFEGGQA